ncbi:hypothetical protein LtaPh_3436700 [Leishmania tarentolae]|uniref:Uncharacterized protein n=1 Tax=Leishmania tarentolae TaxID=5689 RepID=A0A640KSD3_LEITA|nr:hypothetical protein LtaPh_3436700 [Leishmania tarentolae]
MTLPPVLHIGPHELKLLPICRSAEVVSGRRRCNDTLLTAFCFVGELETDAVDLSGYIGDADKHSSRGATISWYYSPLFQFEHKRIRVEEGVVEAALTKEVATHQHADVNSFSLQFGVAGIAKHEDSCSTRSGEGSSAEMSVASAVALPALYLRIGNSTTFREYRLVREGQKRSISCGASTKLHAQSEAEVTSNNGSDVSVQVAHRPPTLQPLAPRRPTLRPIDAREDGNGLRNMARRSYKRISAPRRCGFPDKAPLEHLAAPVVDEVRMPQQPSPFCTGAETAMATSRVHSAQNEGSNKPFEAVRLMQVPPSCRENSQPSSHIANEGKLSQWAPPADHCETSEASAHKGTPHDNHSFSAAGGSSVSSAYLSNSLFLYMPPKSPTSVLSPARSGEADTYDILSSTGVSASSGLFFDTHLHSREVTCLVSDVYTPLSQRTFSLTTLTAPKPKLTRTLALCTVGNGSDDITRSIDVPQNSESQGVQLEVE